MLISCVMPTHNRRHLLGLAVRAFYAQDWPDKELIVVDDGSDCVADCLQQLVGVTHIYHSRKLRIGEKRNIACERAKGKVCINWDDDDWSAPNRITDQVFRLAATGKDVTAYDSLIFWDESRQEARRWIGEPGYGPGSTQAYRRSYWERNPHPNASVGEDGMFVELAQRENRITTVPGAHMMVARIHEWNSANRAPGDWPLVDRSEVPTKFFEDLKC